MNEFVRDGEGPLVPRWFSTDPFMGRMFVPGEYNCFDFDRDVWFAMTGEDIKDRLRILHLPIAERRVSRSDATAFRKLRFWRDPCHVMMRSPRVEPHIGVFMRGKFIHLSKRLGVIFERLENVAPYFKTVSYYL